MKRRLSLITLGANDVANARHLYQRLGWNAADNRSETAFFQENRMIFELWVRNELAADRGAFDDSGWEGITLAQKVTSISSVDATLLEAQRARETVVREGAPTKWGGCSEAFADPDGDRWEIALNLFSTVTEDSSTRLVSLNLSFPNVKMSWPA